MFETGDSEVFGKGSRDWSSFVGYLLVGEGRSEGRIAYCRDRGRRILSKGVGEPHADRLDRGEGMRRRW